LACFDLARDDGRDVFHHLIEVRVFRLALLVLLLLEALDRLDGTVQLLLLASVDDRLNELVLFRDALFERAKRGIVRRRFAASATCLRSTPYCWASMRRPLAGSLVRNSLAATSERM
jgi:hypothetical protein